MARKTISMGRNSSNNSGVLIEREDTKISNPSNNGRIQTADKSNIQKTPVCFVEEAAEQSPKSVQVNSKSKSENLTLILLRSEFKRGIITENPVFRLVLGICPALAVTTAASSAIGMGIAATIVLICSNTVISLMKNIIPEKVRIPAYITIIASFVSAIQMLIKAFLPWLNESLGIYLPLIVVNCIILGRAEMYASKNQPLASAIDGAVMGAGFTSALFCMGIIRELLGTGSIFGIQIISGGGIVQPILFFSLAPGGFFVLGMLIAAANKLSRKNNLPVRTGCGDCPAAASCSMSDKGGRR